MPGLVAATGMPMLNAIGSSLVAVTAFGLTTAASYAISWLLWLSGVVFVIFGITLALGVLTRISALLILVTLIPITIAVHVAPGPAGPLFKNIAIMGALLYFYANGPGRFAIDNRGGSDLSKP